MADLAKLIVSLEAQTAKYQKELQKANRKLSGFERRQKKSIQGIARGFKALGAAVAGVQFGKLVSGAVNAADNLAKVNQRLGISVEALSELNFAAEQSGVNLRTLELGLQRLQRRVAEAAQGTGEAKAAIAELGIDAARLARLPLDQQFEIVGEALSRVGTEADRTRLAVKLFDSEGLALLQTLEGGQDAVRAFREQARQLGAVITTESAEAAADLKDRLNELSAAFRGLSNAILQSGVVEGLTQFLNLSREIIGGVDEYDKLLRRQAKLLDDIGKIEQLPGLATNASQLDNLRNLRAELAALEKQIVALAPKQAARRVSSATSTSSGGATLADVFRGLDEVNVEENLRGILVATKGVSEETRKFFDDATDRARELDNVAQNLGFTFQSAFEDAIVEGGKLSDVFKGLLQDIIRIGARLTITAPLGRFLGGTFAGFFADGGRIGAGQFGIAGEAGPEFVYGPATVVPAGGAGGGITIMQTVNATGADSEVRRALPGLLEQSKQATINEVARLQAEGKLR